MISVMKQTINRLNSFRNAVLATSLGAALLCSAHAQADVPTVYAIDIPGLHQKDGKGAYDTIVDKVLISEEKAKLKVLPPARAESKFKLCTNCCWSPANKSSEFYDFGDSVKMTDAMDTAKVYIFTAPDQPVISTLEGLKDKKVGIRHGMPYGRTFEAAKLDVNSAKDIETNIAMLEAGRIDAFIAYVPDAYVAFDELGKEKFPHDVDRPVVVHPDALVCKGVDDAFIQSFNEGLKGL